MFLSLIFKPKKAEPVKTTSTPNTKALICDLEYASKSWKYIPAVKMASFQELLTSTNFIMENKIKIIKKM